MAESYGISGVVSKTDGDKGKEQFAIKAVGQMVKSDRPSDVGITTDMYRIRQEKMPPPVQPMNQGLTAKRTSIFDTPINLEQQPTSKQQYYTTKNIINDSYFNRWPRNYKSVYLYIYNHPNDSAQQISNDTGISESEITYIAKWLEENGIIGSKEMPSEPVVTMQDISQNKSWDEVKEDNTKSVEKLTRFSDRSLSPGVSVLKL